MDKGKLLILIGTHGDEATLGRRAIERIKDWEHIPEYDPESDRKVPRVAWMLANPKAAARRVRFTEADLNRCAPGNRDSDRYEERRAAEVLEAMDKFENVIDIHGTSTNSGLFAIVTNPAPASFRLASSLAVPYVVVWSSRKQKKTGPLTQFHPCAVEIECGPKNEKMIDQAVGEVVHAFMHGEVVHAFVNDDRSASTTNQHWFVVDGKVMIAEADLATVASWREFKPVTHGGDTFCPILLNKTDEPLANSPTYAGVRCHKARRIDFRELFSR